MILRPYQIKLVRGAYRAISNGQHPCLVAPTGAGKTVMAAHMAREAYEAGWCVAFLTHRNQIREQAMGALGAIAQVTPLVGSWFDSSGELVLVGSVQSVARWCGHWGIPGRKTLLFLDEAHHAVSESWGKAVEVIRPDAMVGLTATPQRLDGQGLDGVFDTLVQEVNPKDLMDQGFLAKPAVYAPPFDRTKLKVKAGEYVRGSARFGMVGDLWGMWSAHGYGKTIVACSSVAMAERAAAYLRERAGLGVVFEYHSGRKALQNEADMDRFKKWPSPMFLVCVDALIEGFDMPDIDTLVVLRPTMSVVVWNQLVGRLLRPKPGRPKVLLDHVGNTHVHGLPWIDPVTWTLKGKKRKGREEGKAHSIWYCPSCFAVNETGETVCGSCGEERKIERRKARGGMKLNADGELVRFGAGAAENDTPEQKKAWYAKEVARVSERKMRLGSARHSYKDRYGSWPVRLGWIERENYECSVYESRGDHDWQHGLHGSPRRCSMCLVKDGQS